MNSTVTSATINNHKTMSTTKSARRQRANAYGINRMLNSAPAYRNFNSTTKRSAVKGFRLWTKQVNGLYATIDDLCETMLECQDFTVPAAQVISDYAQMGLTTRAPVAAAVYHTFYKAKRLAKEFWTGVFTGGPDLGNKDIRHNLYSALLHTATYISSRSPSVKHRVTQQEMFDMCIEAWSRWRLERKMGNRS